jgi:glycosyltransferase involved in cell wall biosynthesis
MDPYGSNRVALLLASFLSTRHDILVASPKVSEKVRPLFPEKNVTIVDLDEGLLSRSSSMAYGEAWARETLLKTNGKSWKQVKRNSSIVINISNTIIAPADVWYLQGAVGYTASWIIRLLPKSFSRVGKLADPVLSALDRRQIALSSSNSSIRIANSSYCRSYYLEHGIPVEGVIFPPLDISVFKASTPNPAGDYCVAYIGKETDPNFLFSLADAGIRLRAFGTKLVNIPSRVHPNITLEGRFTDRALAELYSNAKLTIFPFTTEPFGYIPVESMACGTPVLTYNREGPAETILNGKTGWVCPDDQSMARKAIELWKGSTITPAMRTECRRRATEYSLENVGKQWMELLERMPEQR